MSDDRDHSRTLKAALWCVAALAIVWIAYTIYLVFGGASAALSH